MGGISHITGDIVSAGTGGLINPNAGEEAADAARAASQTQADYQNRALDYLKQENVMPEQARTQLGKLFMGGEGSADAMANLKQSPLYQSVLDTGAQGREALMRNQAMTGGLRSGSTQDALYNFNTGLQQQALQSGIGGLQSLAGVNYTPQIAQTTAGIGQTLGQGIIGANQSQNAANQQLLSTLLGGAQAAAAFSDRRLKQNIKYIGDENGHKTYTWTWNDLANDYFGLKGESRGVIADEVEKVMPEAISENAGFNMVNYDMIGVQHG